MRGILVSTYTEDMTRGLVRAGTTYDCGVYEGGPALLVFEQGKHEGHSGGAQQDDDQLVLELLEDELPDGRRRVFWQCYNGLSVYAYVSSSERAAYRSCRALRAASRSAAWTSLAAPSRQSA